MKKLCGMFLIIGSFSCFAFAGEADGQFDESCIDSATHIESSSNDKVQEVLMSYSEIMHFYHNKIEEDMYALLAEKEKALALRYASKFNAITAAKLDLFLSQSKHFSFAFSQ